MSTIERPQLPAPGAVMPPGPYLCKVWDPLPTGWQRTGAVKRTATCLAFDPSRHTVVQNIDNRNQEHLAQIVAQAGFKNFQVPGTETGFFARDRQTAPPPVMKRSHEGLSR